MGKILRAVLLLGLLTTPAWAQSPQVFAPLDSATCPGTGCIGLQVAGLAGIGLQVTGTYSGTISFEASIDGTTFVALNLTPLNSTTAATSTTTTGVWTGGVGGAAIVRARMSSYTSGTALVTLKAAPTSARGGSGSATPPGSDTQVIFNDGGVEGADAGLVYNKTTDTLTAATGFSIASSSTMTALGFAPSGSADVFYIRDSAGMGGITDGTGNNATNNRDLRLRHLLGGGTAPVVSNTSANSCGTSAATIVGSDMGGKVTVGATSGTSCTVTFRIAYPNAPPCWANNETTANLARTTSTTTTVIIGGTFVGGDVVSWGCGPSY